MSTIFEKLAAGQTPFTDESREGAYVITQALGAAEPSALEIRATIVQYRANYARPAPNTTLTYDNGAGSDVTAYFVDDVDFQDRGGGLQSWTRLWATIPASWSEPGGTFAFTFPAYIQSVAFGSLFPVTGIYQYNTNYTICNTNSTASAPGTDAFFDLNYLRSNQNYHVSFTTSILSWSSGSYVSIANCLPGVGTWSGVTGTIRAGQYGRLLPETIEVDSFLQHDYVLADEVSVDTLLPQVDKFSPVNSSGYEVDTLSTGTATIPNSATYSSMISAGTLIVARRSDRRKYAGNIYERTTLLVKAR